MSFLLFLSLLLLLAAERGAAFAFPIDAAGSTGRSNSRRRSWVVRRGNAAARSTSVVGDEASVADVDSVDADVVVVGGGLTGLATRLALRNRGVRSVGVYERACELRKVGAAIGLYPNGMAALEYVDSGVCRRVRRMASPCQTFERRDLRDDVVRTTRVAKIEATAPVMFAWYMLQKALLDALPPDTVHLGCELTSYRILENGTVRAHFRNRRDGTTFARTCRVLVGADRCPFASEGADDGTPD